MDLPEITTQRLTLRCPEVTDAEAMVRHVGNLEVSRWLTQVPYPYDLSDALSYIERVRAGAFGRSWVITDADGLCGAIGLDGELGYWLGQEVWGQGYGGEAVAAVLTHHFQDPWAEPIVSSHFVENARSARVLTRSGLAYCGAQTKVRSLATGNTHAMRHLCLVPEQWHALHPWRMETTRLEIRPLTQADAPEIARIGDDARVAPMLMTVPMPWPEAEVRRWIELSRWRGRAGFRMALVLKGNQKVVGCLGVGPDRSLAYFLDPAYWNQGLITEALHVFVPAVLGRFGFDALVAEAFQDNPASLRVLAKLGFRETGRDVGGSAARVEPAPVRVYRLSRSDLGGARP